MNRIVNFLQKYFAVISVLIGISILLSVTFSSYIVTSNNHKAAEMYIGELKYSMEINGSTTNTLSVPTGETIIDVKVNNQNPVDTYYKLLYLKNSNLTVKYYETTKDTDEVVTTYSKPNDSIAGSNSNNIKLLITNNSTSSQNVAFTMKGGYITNTVEDITTPSIYSEITSVEAPSTNTYFCKTNDTLTQGLKYVNGQYTYAYKQEGSYVSSGLAWYNISNNGWGVQLTDKTSTDSVTSKVCTYINNKPVVSMSYMFSDSKVTTLDVSNFNTSKVTNMSFMFYNSQATTLDVSNFNISNVTNMKGMFYKSKAITLDVSNFDTSNVTNMGIMFSNSQATTIDVSNFDTSNVTDMGYMFFYSQATILDVSNFDTSNVTNMENMFYRSKATTLDVSNFDTSNVTNMDGMFYSSQATTIDVSNFNTSKVTNMSSMFQSSQATTIDVSNFDTSKVTDMSSMFSSSQATTIDVSNFNTSKVTNMRYMFSDSKATTLDVSNFNTSNVTNMENMFYKSKATTLDLSNFDTSKVTYMSYMFWNSQATTIDLSNFDTSNVTHMLGMFSDSKATTLDVSNFDTSKVTDMSIMFYNSTNLKTIYVSNKFNTDKVTDSTSMFSGCTKLIGGAGTKYNSSYVDKIYARIDGGTNNPGYFTDINNQPSTFSTDDWTTIISSVKSGNTRGYKVGETKEVSLGTAYGTHTLRIANTSTPSECSTEGFSQSACGFVLEFTDSVTNSVMNSGSTDTNVGGWNSSLVRTLVNGKIYNALPSDLKKGIINTTVVSGHGEGDKSNFSSTDKLYLLSPIEVWSYDNSDNAIKTDTSRFLTRQLDYYASIGVTTSNYSGAIKKNNPSLNFDWWWLRSAYSKDSHTFFAVKPNGDWFWIGTRSNYTGVSPAFRIG